MGSGNAVLEALANFRHRLWSIPSFPRLQTSRENQGSSLSFKRTFLSLVSTANASLGPVRCLVQADCAEYLTWIEYSAGFRVTHPEDVVAALERFIQLPVILETRNDRQEQKPFSRLV